MHQKVKCTANAMDRERAAGAGRSAHAAFFAGSLWVRGNHRHIGIACGAAFVEVCCQEFRQDVRSKHVNVGVDETCALVESCITETQTFKSRALHE